MTLTLQQAKDEVAKNKGYKNWLDMMDFTMYNALEDLTNEAAELYAQAKAKEAFEAACQLQIDNCLASLRPTFNDSLAYGDIASAKHPDYEAYLNKKPI